MLRVHCDHCGTDLSCSSNSIDYRVTVQAEAIPPHAGAVTDMMIYPPLDRPHHFCGLGCVRAWADKVAPMPKG